MGHPQGPGRSGSGVDGVTDQAIKPMMAARISNTRHEKGRIEGRHSEDWKKR